MQYETEESRVMQFNPDATVNFEDTQLSPKLVQALRSQMGVNCLFEMQQTVFSHLLNVTSKALVGDVILCAPTGSGKTLAYALPIMQSLMNRVIPKLRAIIVVPTRELANQVANVFSILASTVGMTVSVISGASSIAKEATVLSKTEILVATPGRLVDHIENSNEMILKGVKYLVLDESDRLLQESYQGWIDTVIPILGNQEGKVSGQTTSVTLRRPDSGILALAIQPDVSARSFSRSSDVSEESVRKILVSATQTRNPKRLVRLGLRRPTYFEPTPEDSNMDGAHTTGGYSVPSSMTENGWVVSKMQDKPMALLKMLGWSEGLYPDIADSHRKVPKLPPGGVKLIFTKSIESAHRLSRLLELCAYRLGKVGRILEMSGELSSKKREQVLEIVRQPHFLAEEKNSSKQEPPFVLVVCSDVLARGMDMFHVDAVINYDVPIHIRTYLHRAGRTARAGRKGMVSTLLLSKQVHHFRQMVYQAERRGQKVRVNNLSVVRDERRFLFSVVADGLSLLRRIIARENLGLVAVGDSLPAHMLYALWLQIESSTNDEEDPKSDEDEDRHQSTEDDTISLEPVKKRRKAELEQNFTEKSIVTDEDLEVDVDVTDGGDTFHDLLFAQIARNLQSAIDNDKTVETS